MFFYSQNNQVIKEKPHNGADACNKSSILFWKIENTNGVNTSVVNGAS